MAYIRLGHIKENQGKGGNAVGLYRCIDYIFNPLKTNNREYVGGYNISLGEGDITGHVYKAMLDTKEAFRKEWGRQGYHYKLSFAENDKVSPELALTITHELCEKCFTDYECAYAVHDNAKHLHSHIVFNSIDMVQGYKYHYKPGDWAKIIQPAANEICERYGLSQISLDLDEKMRLTHKCKSYGKWRKERGTDTGSECLAYTNNMIRRDLDECIAKAETYDGFLVMMRDKGHIVDDSKKHLTILAPGRQRACRTYKLTADNQTYTRENIKKMIAGIYLSRNEVKRKLTEEWNKYADEKVSVKIIRLSPALAKFSETWDFQKAKGLKNGDDIRFYKEYLNCADKELNILRKYVNRSMSARMGALESLNSLLPLLQYYKRYINGEAQFKKEYDAAAALYNNIREKGYGITELYRYQCAGERLLARIEKYKRHIFVERKICDRLERIIKDNMRSETHEAQLSESGSDGNKRNGRNKITDVVKK